MYTYRSKRSVTLAVMMAFLVPYAAAAQPAVPTQPAAPAQPVTAPQPAEITQPATQPAQPAPPASPGVQIPIKVPRGTAVLLKFATPIASSTAKVGDPVHFLVEEDVVWQGVVVIPKGNRAVGLITAVSPPGFFGQPARLEIGFQYVLAADGAQLKLGPSVRRGDPHDQYGAAALSVVGLRLLGVVGIVAGVLVKGGHIEIHEGVKTTAELLQDEMVRVTLAASR
ncbi:MAG: hypothetical protein HY660_12170 [Armatimonadetes bacterium]|nr:hypothetical protein [Armatimonadota bacterium]